MGLRASFLGDCDCDPKELGPVDLDQGGLVRLHRPGCPGTRPWLLQASGGRKAEWAAASKEWSHMDLAARTGSGRWPIFTPATLSWARCWGCGRHWQSTTGDHSKFLSRVANYGKFSADGTF